MQFRRICNRMLCLGIVGGSLFWVPTAASAQVRYMMNFGGVPISCSIEEDQAVIRGIHGNDPIEKVVSLLGKPISASKDRTYVSYLYPGMSIKFWNIGTDNKYRVCSLNVYSEGYYTPDGVGVGMPASALSEIYGTADVVYTEKSVAPKLSAEQQAKYAKLGKTIYTYNVSAGLALQFEVRNEKISSIKIITSD